MIARHLLVSRAAPGVGPAEVCDIVRVAYARNAAAGLTGALLFLDGWFVQALEGPAEALAAAFERIRRDPRHGGLELRLRGPALCPVFRGRPLALRMRGCLDEDFLAAFDYRPGFPVEAFPADVLLEFTIAACAQIGARRAG